MGRIIDSVLVVDVEATCWNGPQPEDQESEIIEIGLCLFDTLTQEISQPESILVKPERSTVSEFCTKLTTLTQEQVDQGISFKEACEYLREKYLSSKRPWASFGAYDMNQFQKQCASYQVPYPFSSVHINVKTLFSLKMKMDKELGMAGALKMMNEPLEGTHHRGVDDARNIAKILKFILN